MLNKRKRVLIAITFAIIMIILTVTTSNIEQYKSNENIILAVVWALTKNYKNTADYFNCCNFSIWKDFTNKNVQLT